MEHFFEARNVAVDFETSKETVQALNGFSLGLDKGDILGLVGESGSGKSVAVSAMINLIRPPGKILGGEVLYRGKDLLAMPEAELQKLRGGAIGVIPAGAKSMLHPMLPVGKQIANVYRAHNPGVSKQEAMEKAVEVLDLVQIPDARRRITALPKEFSGGMAQRVLIAIALVNNPELVIADDATTGLDVTVQAQVLDLVRDKVAQLGCAAVLITHDLGIVAQYCRKAGILFAGRVVESCDSVEQLLRGAAHPYTRTLISATPGVPEPFCQEVTASSSSRNVIPRQGCLVQHRCMRRRELCEREAPPLREIAPGHCVQCHFAGEGAAV